MKTSIKTLFAAALTTIILGTASVAANATENNNNYTNLTSIKNISKIKISGNVKLILVQDANESVEVFDNYFAKNALVQQQNGELRISSFTATPLTVIAHVNNISSIEASNTSTVATAGNFNLLNLNVVLNDNAAADIKANTVSLITSINGSSNLVLSGSTESYTAVLGSSAKVGMNDFTANDSNVSAAPLATTYSANRYEDLKIEVLESIF
ncbi:GIN domain-containing protein [Pedobacter jamesrossensis]|uniref:GIN domain-containing protein n=1 Tax=Pedobacter jamesrossensis TaxID=1908238 RepID=A0ABV8NKL9_9SPHI